MKPDDERGWSLRRGTRMIADTLLGWILVATGLLMLLTPGPGILAIVAGLALLARHYHSADRLKRAALGQISDAGTALRARRTDRRLARTTGTNVAAVDDEVEAA